MRARILLDRDGVCLCGRCQYEAGKTSYDFHGFLIRHTDPEIIASLKERRNRPSWLARMVRWLRK